MSFEKNTHNSTSIWKVIPMFGVGQVLVSQMHPNEMISTWELMEDDLDTRTYFCEQMIALLDNTVINN